MRAALCLATTGTTFDSNDQGSAWTHQGLLAGETGIRSRWRHDRPKHAHAAKGFCRSSGLGEGGRAAGCRRHPGGAWRPLASRPASQGVGKMVARRVVPAVAEPVAAFLPPRSAKTHVQPVSGTVVSPGGCTGRPGRPAPQVKATLGLAKSHKGPYRNQVAGSLDLQNRSVTIVSPSSAHPGSHGHYCCGGLYLLLALPCLRTFGSKASHMR